MKNFWDTRFIHVLLLILLGLLFFLFVIAFIPFTLTSGNYFVQGCNVYDLFRAITSSSWGSILLLFLVGLFILMSGLVIWLKLKNKKHVRGLSVATGIVYIMAIVVFFLYARPYFVKTKQGAMQDLILRDTLFVKVNPLPETKGFWAYPSVSFFSIDSSKKYAFVHYNFNLRGHDNVYVYQKYWSVVHNDTLIINPHPWINDRKLFLNNVAFYLKEKTFIKFVDSFSLKWFTVRKPGNILIDSIRMSLYLSKGNGQK